MRGDVLLPGTAHGTVLRLDAPISFWGGVDPVTALIMLAGHPQRGETVAGTILVIPRLVGSSSSSAIMLELIHGKVAPKAVILGARDAILPVGVVAAGQMGWPTLPVLVVPDPPFRTGEQLTIHENGSIDRKG